MMLYDGMVRIVVMGSLDETAVCNVGSPSTSDSRFAGLAAFAARFPGAASRSWRVWAQIWAYLSKISMCRGPHLATRRVTGSTSCHALSAVRAGWARWWYG